MSFDRRQNSEALRNALAHRDDGAAAQLIQECTAEGSLPSVTFAELAAADLGQAAVAVAQAEAGQADLREATADFSCTSGSYLHAAAAAGTGPAVIAALLAAGCAIECCDDDGGTALHVAAKFGHLASMKALLEAGCNALVRNKNGRTARGQGGLSEEVRCFLVEAEETSKVGKAARQEALWGSKVQATQTDNAFRTGCV